MNHLLFLEIVASEDIGHLRMKEKTYKGSWKKSGGRSAWFMIKRKIDRLESMMQADPLESDLTALKSEHDIFERIKMDMSGVDGSVLAEVRDLRRYLLLVESEILSMRSKLPTPGSIIGVTASSGGEHGAVHPQSGDTRPNLSVPHSMPTDTLKGTLQSGVYPAASGYTESGLVDWSTPPKNTPLSGGRRIAPGQIFFYNSDADKIAPAQGVSHGPTLDNFNKIPLDSVANPSQMKPVIDSAPDDTDHRFGGCTVREFLGIP
jgi:hypothetical protein